MDEKLKETIKSSYKEFDDWFEENEVPPYNAAYLYYEAGYLKALSDLDNRLHDCEEERSADAV